MTKSRKRVQSRQKSGQTSAISPVLIGVVAAAAVLVVVGLILLSNQSNTGGGAIDSGQFPTLGRADAPVTITEFSDYG